jgi:hypothetical protein
MVYHDDQMPPNRHQNLPCDPWDDTGVSPVAPTDEQRRAVQAAMDRHPNHGAERIKSDIWREGRDVPLNVILGVKAGM